MFEVISEKPVAWPAVRKSLDEAILRHIGELGYAKAGVQLMDKHWNTLLSRGMLRTTHTSLEVVRSSLGFVRDIDGKPVVVRSVGASGILKRAVARYLDKSGDKCAKKIKRN